MPNNDVYIGEFKNAKRSGFGKFETKDFVYIGFFANGF